MSFFKMFKSYQIIQLILFKIEPESHNSDSSSSDEELESDSSKSISHTETEKSYNQEEQQSKDVADMISSILGLLVLKRQKKIF